SSTKIRLEVYNAKTESITGVIVTPVTNATVVPSQYFIGSMDPDDVFSASFDIYTDNLEYKNYTIGFKVSFKQDNDYYESPIIGSSFSVIPASANAGDAIIVTSVGLVIALIIITLILFFIWKKRRNVK
ncbi:MAG: hypothetical protein DRO67_09145, partial [Candidatus Asgardarchaeum californiense]